MGQKCQVITVLLAASELRFFLAALRLAACHWLLPITCLSLAAFKQLALIGWPRLS